MKLARIQLVEQGGPLASPLTNARAEWRERRSVLVEVADDAGHVGRGEASPLPGYSPDTLEQAREALSRWARAAEGRSLRDAEEAVDLEGLLHAARCAAQTALLDLEGHAEGRSLPALLGAASDASVPLSLALPERPLEEVLARAQDAFDAGYRTFKLKIGRDFDAELEVLSALRAAFAGEVALRLDANGSLDPDVAIDQLRVLSVLNPEFIEEPVPLEALSILEGSAVPVALDESLLRMDIHAFHKAVEQKLVQVAVLKPMLWGGPEYCLTIARDLAERGLAITVSHTWDGPQAMTAAAAVALALAAGPARLLACGLAPHPALAAWPPAELPYLAQGNARAWTAPGLGLP